jgi:hypothetical protein
MFVKVGGHPMESVSHGLWKEKWGGVPSLIKEHKSANLSLKICLVWKIVRTLLPVADKNNHLSKQIFISVLQMKSSSTCLITTSLWEGPFFYFYVESPPSTFMHRLREYSCHSECNAHSPKFIIDWFMIMILLVLKLFVSSRPLKLEGVLCIFFWNWCPMHLCFATPWRTSWKPLCYVFLYAQNTHLTFNALLLLIFCLCYFSCYNMVAKFYCQDYVFYAHI